MVCKVCSKTTKPDESLDCFEIALDSLRQHYKFYRESFMQRDLELQQFKERNEQLNKALELLQKAQQPTKRFKANHRENTWIAPPVDKKNKNAPSDELVTTDISLSDDDDAGASNLNMALNSEQLFETSVTSPSRPQANITSSEMIISPRAKVSLERNKQRENLRTLNDRNKLIEKSKSEWHVKERASPKDKSWAVSLLKPATLKDGESKVGVNVKPEIKKSLSLKKAKHSKMKQSILQFNNSKDSSMTDSDVCEDIIDASPIVCKNSRAGKSWIHRNGPNHSSHNSSNLTSNNKSTGLLHEDNKQNHDETASIPIENIVFDFSPTKKPDPKALTTTPAPSKLCKTQLYFNADETTTGNDTTTDCMVLAHDQMTIDKSMDGSSVVMLTPATQDIIFLDDTSNEFSDINTMDLLADIEKQETEYMENLKKYESKNIEKQQRQDLKQKLERPLATKEDKTSNFIKPVAAVKKEKVTQEEMIEQGKHHTNVPQDKVEEEEEDEDEMPRPIKVKQEADKDRGATKKLSIKERFNIDCDDCEKYIRFIGDRLSDREIEEHLNNCLRHKKQDVMRQNTPEDFWNPFILSFAENDPRNEVLIDTRFKHNKPLGK